MEDPNEICDICGKNGASIYGYTCICDKCWDRDFQPDLDKCNEEK